MNKFKHCVVESKTSKVQKFKDWAGDVDWRYGKVWGRALSPTRFHFVEIDEVCENSWEKGDWYVTLREVDVAAVSLSELESAMDSCGWDGVPNSNEAKAEVLRSYGTAAVLSDEL